MTPAWLDALIDALDCDGKAVLITLAASEGSAPRAAGTRMVLADAGPAGTIGGGRLEYIALDQAKKLLDAAPGSFRLQAYPLGPLLAQCCGGHVRVLLERLGPDHLPVFRELRDRLTRQGMAVLVSELSGPFLTIRLSDDATCPGLQTGAGEAALRSAKAGPGEKDVTRFIDRIEVERHALFLFGAGHVGAATARLVATLPFETRWIDSRPGLFPATPLSRVRTEPRNDPVAVVAEAPPGALFVIFSHSHELDFELTRAVLARGDALYCGLIGSATKRARFSRRLIEVGLEAEIGRLTCPIGAGGPPGKEPEVIALGLAAELLCVARAAREDAPAHNRPILAEARSHGI